MSLGGSCMLQDPSGFILVCTEHGVFAYDGRRFFNLGPDQGLRQGNPVYSIALTQEGRVAVGYADEVFVSDRPAGSSHSPEALSFQPVRHPAQNFYSEGVRRLTRWRDGLVLLVADTTQRIVLPDAGTPHTEPMAYGPKEADLLRGAKAVFSVAGRLWETFEDGRICTADPGSVRCYKPGGAQRGVWLDVTAGRAGHVFARSLTAVADLDPTSGQANVVDLPDQGGRYMNYTTKLGLVRAPDGTLLTQADHGLAVMRQDGWHELSVDDGAPSGIIVSMLTDSTGQLWFQVLGRGLVRWLGFSHWETVEKADGLSDGLAWQTARGAGGKGAETSLWVSTDTGVDEVVRRSGALRIGRVLPGSSFALAIGPRGRLWRSSADDGIKVLDPLSDETTELHVPPVNAILAGADETVWVGTLGGLFRVEDHPGAKLRPSLDQGPRVPVVSMEGDGAGGVYYVADAHMRWRRADGTDVAVLGAWPSGGFEPLALARGRGHAMWVGGAGGLYCLELSGQTVLSYAPVRTSDTRTNSIIAVIVDHRGWVWAGTALGVSVFDGQRWVSVDADSGLASDDVDQLGLREDPDGSVWIVTSQGLSHLLDPGWLFADRELHAFVSGETVGGRPVLGRSLPFTQDAIAVQFGTSSYGAENSVTFRYRLSGVDAGWAETQSGLVRYPFVPPGHHMLSVVAYDELTHRASPPATLPIDIGYPWWRHWWAECLWLICAIALLYGAVRLHFERLLARQATLRRMVDDATRQLQHQAAHDSLTGLLNRSEIESRLAGKLSRVMADNELLVALIDIDHFKRVNDEYGHLDGDQVLRRVGELVRTVARPGDSVGRYGGEEILIVIEDHDRSGAERVTAFHDMFRDEVFETSSDHTIHVTCSIGLAAAVCGDDWESLVGRADDALYEAKASGRDRIVRSRQADLTRAAPEGGAGRGFKRRARPGRSVSGEGKARAVALTADLRRVDPDREMELFYQPVVRIQRPYSAAAEHDRPPAPPALVGYEALLRWNHPTRGLVMPGEFVKLSENSGTIDRLGAWTLKRACADAAHWPDNLTVAINVSPMQFRSGELLERLQEALGETGIDPRRVEVEVTETTMLLDDDAALFTLRQIRACGVKIALDDFGTGFSSLSYLRWFQFDRIKIDRSFVSDICKQEDAASITRTILGLGRSLNIPVTAEGVESAEQVAILRAEGCTHAQGYLFGRPEPKRRLSFMAAAAEQ